WHICCDYQYYSVPFQYIGKTLRARLTNSLVSIFDGDELVAEHSRMHGFKYRYCTDPAHTPDKDIAGIKPLTRNELLARASSFGPATTKVVLSILDRNAKAIPRGLHTARNVLEVPRVLFLGICLDFHSFSTWVVFPKFGFDFSRRAVA
ncbi:Mu transposase domain-containing protein, partial [Corynebacterium striatum]